MISINIDKAKAITKDRLRSERDPLLKQLDIDFMKAIERGEDTAPIVAEKQRLRDITQEVDSLQTVEELKAISCQGGE